MTELIAPNVEAEEVQPGVIRQIIHLKPVAYRENGTLRAMSQEWGDGDTDRPHIVTAAPLMVSAGNNGMRRFHPTREADKYLEIGAPFVQVGGNWTQVNLGTPTRNGKRLTWTTTNADFRIDMGGHFSKLEIELKNGYVPQNSRVAFPVGIQGLTRSGVNILDAGQVVARLQPFVMYDAANEQDVRPIAHQFTNLNGQPYLLLTLPNLTGMARPVIDPTLTLQPDGTAGIDTFIRSDNATTNFGTNTLLLIGHFTASQTTRSLIKFDLSSLPSDAVISAATFSLYMVSDNASSAGVFRVYRQKRAWIETQATWNIYSTGNNWTVAGAFDSADCEQTDIGNLSLSSAETINAFKDWPLTPTTKAGLDLGNGWLIKTDAEATDQYRFASSDDSTAANRPKLVIDYTEAAAGHPAMRRWRGSILPTGAQRIGRGW